MNVSLTVSGNLNAYEAEVLVAGSSAVGLTESKWKQRGSPEARDKGNARVVMMTVEGKVRWWIHGEDPTADVGHFQDGGEITLAAEHQFANFRVIRDASAGSDVNIMVSYLR